MFQNIDFGYSLEPPRCTHNLCFEQKVKNIFFFFLKMFNFYCLGKICMTRVCFRNVSHHVYITSSTNTVKEKLISILIVSYFLIQIFVPFKIISAHMRRANTPRKTTWHTCKQNLACLTWPMRGSISLQAQQ